MKPYYEDDACVIYHGDCREIDAWDVAGAVMMTDPPYGRSFVTNKPRSGGGINAGPRRAGLNRTSPVIGDESTDLRDDVLAVWQPRPALVFGTWRSPRPEGVRLVLIWDKGPLCGMGDLSLPWGLSHEEIYVLGSGFVGQRGTGVIRVDGIHPKALDRPDHPTPKPVSLLVSLLVKCPPLADVVDPFMGSGTTLRAAKDLGRKAIGVEIEERYCEIAAKRLAQEVLAFG